LKHLADIAFHSGESWPTVAGMYLSVHESAPETDIGRYSEVRGLVMGLGTLPEPERKRRRKVIDETLDKIQQEPFRTQAFLEKGLALLDSGNREALDYLMRLAEKTS